MKSASGCSRPASRLGGVLLSSAWVTLPLLLSGQALAETSSSSDALVLPTLNIEGDALQGVNALPEAYAGGQIASGGRLGVLGEQKAENVPFSVTGFTEQLIEQQQAQSVAEVLENDASVSVGAGYGNYAETFVIRGMPLYNDDITYGGVYGVLPRQMVSTELLGRVELLKGASAFLNGVSPGGSGIGGSVNLEPKHAGDKPLNKITLDYAADGQAGLSADVSRRFGEADRWGIRVSGLKRKGDTAVDNEETDTDALVAGLDYKGERVRGSLDLGYQRYATDGGRSVVYNGLGTTATSLPDAPDSDTNYSPDWVNSHTETTFALLRGEFDLNDQWTAYGAIGGNKNREYGDYSSPTLSSSNGDSTLYRLSVPYRSYTVSTTAGVRGNFLTGDISHQVNLAYSGFVNRSGSAYTMSGSGSTTNIYNPNTNVAYPATLYASGNMNNPAITSRTQMDGISLSDTLGFMDDRLLVTLGARQQWVEATGYNDEVLSPVYGVVFKPVDGVSVYANHIQGLQQGDTLNVGGVTRQLSPYESKQNEIGVKFERENYGASVALFQIEKPVSTINSNSYYGEQRNRGLELSAHAQPMPALSVFASATFMDPEVRDTVDSSIEGNDAVGVPEYRFVVGGDYKIAAVDGLSVNGKVIRTGSQYLDQANNLELDPWTRLDLGASYETRVADQQVTFRANVKNVTDEDYWASATGGYLTQGAPREVRFSVSTEF
ncbi:TonB-dependent receptor [Pokkaliibacter sp. CJK22405]|uniref:TonB-dependent receptor n=1 Tax=Pokkaliibacter sp. CJK22405 TaxID=3384615 RepID=UPI0039855A3A